MIKFRSDCGSTMLLTVAALCLTAVAGCGRGPAVAQVRGKVLYKDGSIPKGGVRVVRFEPMADSPAQIRKTASAEISAEDGSFELFTRRPGDGVYIGSYAVTFGVYKTARGQESLIVDKYTTSATTPYKIRVDRDVDDLEFEIEPLEP
jgi:hypothetical protein